MLAAGATMGFGDTSKKDKAAAKAADSAAAAAAAAEDADWAEGGKKANKKKEAEAERKAAKAERKAEAEELAQQEEADMSKPKKKDDKKPKMTRAEIAAKAMEKMAAAEKAEKKKKKAIEDSGGNDYIGELTENTNKADGISGSGVDDAMAALDLASRGGGSSSAGGKVNLKAAYAAFEEREMPRLKEENPGLKLSQYKERVQKAWEKSPENPANQTVDVS